MAPLAGIRGPRGRGDHLWPGDLRFLTTRQDRGLPGLAFLLLVALVGPAKSQGRQRPPSGSRPAEFVGAHGFGAGYWVSLVAIAALSWGRQIVASAMACWFLNAVLFGFFVGHHYYKFPWYFSN